MDKSISNTTALLLFIIFAALLGLKFWADDKALDFRGPDHMHTDVAGNLYIMIGNQLLKHDNRGTFIKQYDISALGINDYYGDFAFFNNGDILIRRGLNDIGIVEKYKRYRRMTNETPLEAADEETGLFRCKLDSIECSRFGDGSIDFNRTFHLYIDNPQEYVYVADSSRHTLRVFNAEGVQIAVDDKGYKFPNQLTILENKLYVADTNHHRIVSIDPGPENFGSEIESHSIYSNNPEVITIKQQRQLSQVWPAAFLHTQDLWWVNILNNGMRDGSVYLYNNDWQLLSLLDLPDDADPMDLVLYQDQVLITDLSLSRIYRFDLDGNRLEDFQSSGLQKIIDDNITTQEQFKHLSYGALGGFVVLFAGVFIYALVARHKNKKEQTHSMQENNNNPAQAINSLNSNNSADTSTSAYTTQIHPFIFTGNAREYFGIWIVNIFLIIVTLGIYSAWAKVRTKRYFYGNTLLADSAFDFPANPLSILKGWAIAVGFFMLYNIAIKIMPLSAFIFLILFFVGLPWLMVKAMAFRLHNTTYRNLRFYFSKNYKEAFKVFIGIGLLVPLTLGLIIPSYIYRQKKFIVTHSHYGTTPFQFKAVESKFYEIYGIAILIMIAGGIIFSLLSSLTTAMLAGFEANAFISPFTTMGADADPKVPQGPAFAMLIIMSVSMSLLYLFFFSYINTRIHNIVWNGVEIAGNKFNSTLQVKKIAWLYLSNGIAIIASIGLLVPWARIRMTRYKLENLQFIAHTDLNQFVASEAEQVSATGEQVGEIFDFDIGL